MTLLIDRLLRNNYGIDPHRQERFRGTQQEFLRAMNQRLAGLQQAQVFLIDNCASYVFGPGWGRHTWDTWMPRLVPPFPATWFEYSLPSNPAESWGGLVVRHPREKITGLAQVPHYRDFMDTLHWLLRLEVFVARTDEKRPLHVGGFDLPLDAAGQRLGKEGIPGRVSIYLDADTTDPQAEETIHGLQSAMLPIAFALGLLNCKNVTTTERGPDERQRRAALKRHGHAPMRYHLLQVTPMTGAHLNGSRASGITPSLHIQRGHFKDYREHGLFGKHYGIYWWEFHVRGNPEEGVITKDYEVKPE